MALRHGMLRICPPFTAWRGPVPGRRKYPVSECPQGTGSFQAARSQRSSQGCGNARASAVEHRISFKYLNRIDPGTVLHRQAAGACRYEFQLTLGRKLAQKIVERGWDIDCIVPVPDGSRPAAIELSAALQLPYREGLVKNRYVGRTFIMPDQRTRELSVKRKLNAMPAVFSGKKVLLVDDSIVRGTTMSQIVDMVRKAGAAKVYLASASPAVKFPNVYGESRTAACV